MSEFLEAACALHCASYDRAHAEELGKAKAMLGRDPGLARASLPAAAVTGELDAVRSFLEQDPEAVRRKVEPRGWDPLLYLCFSRFLRKGEDSARAARIVEAAEVLLSNGADPNTYFMLGDERETALYAAVGVNNNPDLARHLLRSGAEVNDEDASYHVAEFEDHECIRVLFEAGMDSRHRATVLLRKLDFDDLEGVRLILALGTDPDEPGGWGKTALHQAIMRGRGPGFVRLLIDAGADVNRTRADGKSPLYLASRFGREDLVEILLDAGARNGLGPEEALVAACGLGDEAMVAEILDENPGIVETLPDVDREAIVDAARGGRIEAVRLFLDAGFDPETRDAQGFTPLHWAAWYGHLDLVRFLLSRGAPFEARNAYGGTVLDSTVWGYANSDGNDDHCVAVLEELVGAGADLSAVSPFPSGHDLCDETLRRLGKEASSS